MQRKIDENGLIHIKSKVYRGKDVSLTKFIHQKVTIYQSNGVYEIYNSNNKYLGELMEVTSA